MNDHLDLGPVPCDEDCAQVGDPGYRERARVECSAYIEQLERTFPVPPAAAGKVEFVTRRHAHDFGTYFEVAIKFDNTSEAAVRYAYEVESSLPPYWDAPAADWLHAAGYLDKREYAPNAG